MKTLLEILDIDNQPNIINQIYMSGKKGKSGGAREGSGRKTKYGEPTKVVLIRVPLSKYSTIMKMIRKYLKKYEK
jgi:hypothetical protein